MFLQQLCISHDEVQRFEWKSLQNDDITLRTLLFFVFVQKGKNGIELQYKKQLELQPAVSTPVKMELLEVRFTFCTNVL